MEVLLMADLLQNRLHEKVMIFSVCYITKSRLNVQFVKKVPLGKFKKIPCEFCEISKNTFFYRKPQVAASKKIVLKKIRDSLTNFTFSF